MKKIALAVFVPFMLAVFVCISFMFMFVNSDNGSSYGGSVNGLPEAIKEEMVLAALDMQSQYGHPASVTLAQIIQESSGKNEGLSSLAYHYKNLFGIKAGKSWKGKTVTKQTGEQTTSGNTYQIKAAFRAYDTWSESIEDRSKLLDNSYPIKGVSDPKEFARCLKKWATAINYSESLIKLMDKYDLYQFDTMTKEEFTSKNTSSGSKSEVVEKAKTKLGCKYVYGASHQMADIKNPNTKVFDCSSFVCWSYYQAGIDIGNKTTAGLIKEGTEISKEQAEPGDIILFSKNPGGKKPSHVGIYLGDDKMIHAPDTGDVVKISKLTSYFKTRLLCYRRIK